MNESIEPLYTPERWQRMRELLAELDELTPAQQEALLQRVADDDAALADAVRALMSSLHTSPAATFGAIERTLVDDAAPANIGPFRLLQPLGEGGMGVVYLAERSGADFTQRVALKLLHRDAARGHGLAARERRILAALAHPNITAFVDAGTSDGRAWLAMEYVDGAPLLDWCEQHALDVRERVRLFDQVCAAVTHAHTQLVVHRDLKPSNVLVAKGGAAKLLDFGIAQVLDAADERTPATRVFTPEYAAPEQLRGERATTATDIYALGLLLFELVSGRRLPADGRERSWTTQELARAAGKTGEAHDTPVNTGDRVLRGDLGRIVAHAIEPEPARRYASVALLREDLARWLDHRPLTLARPGIAYVVSRFVRRHRLGVAAAAVAFAALLATTGIAVWQSRERGLAAERALEQAHRATAMQDFLRDVIAQANPNQNGGDPITPLQLIAKGEALLPRFDNQPALQADMLTQLGQLYIANSDYDRAGVLLDRALKLGESADIPDDVRARVLGGVGEMSIGRSKYQDAVDTTRKGLALLHKDPHADPAAIASMHMHIAQAMDGLGDRKASEAFLRDSLAEDRAALGDKNASVAEEWVLLGWTLGQLERFDEADRAFASGVAAYKSLYGDDGFDVGHAYNEWSLVQSKANRIDDAEKSAREAVRIYEKTVGPTHRKTLSERHALLALMERRGHVVDALPEREKLTALAATPGLTTPRQLAYYYQWLGYDYAQVSRYDDAEAALRKSLVLAAQGGGAYDRLGDNVARRELGVIRVVSGRYADAEAVLRDALAQALAPQPPDMSTARAIKGSLGDLLRLAHRNDEALGLLREATDFPATLSPAHSWRPILLAQRSEAELEAGDIAAAQASAAQSLDYAKKAYPADDFRNAYALYASARIALAQQRGGDAEAPLREALRLRSPPFPADHPSVLEVEVALAQSLAMQHKDAEARALREHIGPLLAAPLPYNADLRARLGAH